MKRRLLAFLLAFVMTFSLVPVNTFALESSGAEVTASAEAVKTEAAKTTAEPAALLAGDEVPAAEQAEEDIVYTASLAKNEGEKDNLAVGDTFGHAYTFSASGTADVESFWGTFRFNPETTEFSWIQDPGIGAELDAEQGILRVGGYSGTLPAGNYSFDVQFVTKALGDATVTLESFKVNDVDYLSKPIAVTRTVGCNVSWTEDAAYTVTGEKLVAVGSNYSFTVAANEGYDATNMVVKVNGNEVAGTDGSYTVENVSSDLTITVEGVTKKVLKPVTVYFSFSHDDKFESCEPSGQTVVLKKVTVPYFDLALYGLENFYFASEDYGPASGDPTGGPGSALDPGTKEFAYGKITMLHLFLYATEVYYLGIDPADAGKGYLADNGMGTDIFNYSGSTGSIFLQNIWNYDLNLNYYLNYEYPLASAGWGSTCDQILLRDGDIVTLGHFSDWSFFNDTTSIFNYIVADKTDPVQGDKIKLELYHAGADMYGTYNTAHTLIDYSPSVYCTPVNGIVSGDVTRWQYVGDAEPDGSLVVDTSKLAPGEYIFALAGQPGKENPGAICSTPGGIRLTIHEKPAVKGDIDGDGVIDVNDVMALSGAINSGDDMDAAIADVNGDGVVDTFDVMALYEIIKSND